MKSLALDGDRDAGALGASTSGGGASAFPVSRTMVRTLRRPSDTTRDGGPGT
jgi:hypothetical protein